MCRKNQAAWEDLMSSYKKLLKAQEDTLAWLEAHNEDGHHNKSIERRKREIERLKANPF